MQYQLGDMGLEHIRHFTQLKKPLDIEIRFFE